jgi:hypothetical protein
LITLRIGAGRYAKVRIVKWRNHAYLAVDDGKSCIAMSRPNGKRVPPEIAYREPSTKARRFWVAERDTTDSAGK